MTITPDFSAVKIAEEGYESFCLSAELNENMIPSFEEYIQWLDEYPGWTSGMLNTLHPAYKKEYFILDLPMNKFYNGKMRHLRLVQ